MRRAHLDAMGYGLGVAGMHWKVVTCKHANVRCGLQSIIAGLEGLTKENEGSRIKKW